MEIGLAGFCAVAHRFGELPDLLPAAGSPHTVLPPVALMGTGDQSLERPAARLDDK